MKKEKAAQKEKLAQEEMEHCRGGEVAQKARKENRSWSTGKVERQFRRQEKKLEVARIYIS